MRKQADGQRSTEMQHESADGRRGLSVAQKKRGKSNEKEMASSRMFIRCRRYAWRVLDWKRKRYTFGRSPQAGATGDLENFAGSAD
jgi:hypothetical protein